jgi:hypothetical protein
MLKNNFFLFLEKNAGFPLINTFKRRSNQKKFLGFFLNLFFDSLKNFKKCLNKFFLKKKYFTGEVKKVKSFLLKLAVKFFNFKLCMLSLNVRSFLKVKNKKDSFLR